MLIVCLVYYSVIFVIDIEYTSIYYHSFCNLLYAVSIPIFEFSIMFYQNKF